MSELKNNVYTEQDIEKVISLIEKTRAEYPEIKEVVDKILEDATPNFWDIIFHKTSAVNLVKKAHEIRYSAMLAWLMNPNENHKLCNMFVKELLERKFEGNPDELTKINKYFSDSDKDSVIVQNEFENIDVYYKNDKNNAHIALEVKQYAFEHNRSNTDISQLKVYKNVVDRESDAIDKNNSCKYFLFLTPLGDEASEGNADWISVDYSDVVYVLDKMISANHDLDFVKIVKDFKKELERTSMNLDFDALKSKIQKFDKKDQDFLIKFAKKLEKDSSLSHDFNKVLFDKNLDEAIYRESLTLISNSFYKQDHTENLDVQNLILEILKHFIKVSSPKKGVKYEVKIQGNEDIIFDEVATTQGKGQGIKFFYKHNEDEYWTYFAGDNSGLVPFTGYLSLGKNGDTNRIYEVTMNKMKAKDVIKDANKFNELIKEFTQALIKISDYVKSDIANN